jgi:hypothetical protein
MNYTKKILSVALIGITTLSLIGCAGRPVSVENTAPNLYEGVKDKGRTITASASGFQLLLFIPIDINDRQERAYQLLKAQANGGFITDVKIKESWTYAFVGTSYKTTITATVYPNN